MKKVLIADADPAELKIFSRILSAYSDIFQVVTAQNGKEAITLMDTHEIDTIVTDLHLEDSDNNSLLNHLRKYHPQKPLFLTTNKGHSQTLDEFKNQGACQLFEKPIDFHELSKKILNEFNASLYGEVHGIGLPYFLQMIELDEKTCSLTIKKDDQLGQMILLNGDLISAETDHLKNEDAVYEILRWEKPSIIIENAIKETNREINQPLENLILNGQRIKNENIKKQPGSAKSKEKTKVIKTTAKESGIQFHVGNSLHIKVEESSFTYRCPLLGFKADHFLILGMPEHFKQKVKLFKGKVIIVKYFYEGIICAFKAKLVSFVDHPAELLFIEYPNLMGYQNIRLQQRTKCYIPAKAAVNNLSRLGAIIDISKNGCGCLIQSLLEKEMSSFNSGENVSLMCKFPGVEGELHIMGKIKNTRSTDEGQVLGIEFHESITTKIQDVITQFVLSIGDLQIPKPDKA